jgi:hypothetical protein
MKKSKKATWYTIVSTGIAFTVLACSTAQAEKMVASYQADNSSMTASKIGADRVQLQAMQATKERKSYLAENKNLVKANSNAFKTGTYIQTAIKKASGEYMLALMREGNALVREGKVLVSNTPGGGNYCGPGGESEKKCQTTNNGGGSGHAR